MILIVSIKDDLHAVTICNVLKKKGYKNCFILACDYIHSDYKINWHLDKIRQSAKLTFQNGDVIDIGEIKLIWWRRVRADQQLPNSITDTHQIKLINNDCRGALGGMLDANFRGKWLSKPEATDRASNKLYQLALAKEYGFRVPETLVSQTKEEVIEFTKKFNGKVIVKPVIGAAGPLMFTEFIGDPQRLDSQSFQICPAIYQEFIEGTKHIRLNCFGDQSYSAMIESEELDWRPNLKVPIHSWEVPASLHKKVRLLLDKLDLEMGIIDIKVTPEGEFVWLEVNPQGQFLFLEPLAKMALSDYFSDYLLKLVQ